MDALALHRDSIVIDGHCDTLLDVLEGKWKLGERSAKGDIDLPRLIEGGVTAQVFAIFIEDKYLPAGAAKQTLRILDTFYHELDQNEDTLVLATKAGDIERAKKEGKVAAVLALEGAESLEGDLALLRMFHHLGVRLLTVTWSRRNQAADGVSETQTGGGLTQFGRQLVDECNRLGIVLDISHLAPVGAREVMERSIYPVVASHSNAQALCSHRRNLTDEQLAALAAKGGVACAVFVPDFVANERKEASSERLLDHIDHMVGVAGVDHVGLGSDFDGFSPPPLAGLEDASHMPTITAGLLRRGYTEDEIRRILGGNTLRVFRQVMG